MEENIIKDKSYKFAIKIIHFSEQLVAKKQFEISRQILKSGTSIGANVEEADGAISRKEFIMKLQIAYKEAKETNFWLRLIRDSKLIGDEISLSELILTSEEMIKLSTAILKTAKDNEYKN